MTTKPNKSLHIDPQLSPPFVASAIATAYHKRRSESASSERGVSQKNTMCLIYCPYTNLKISLEKSNNEHIFPKSLGGVNSFCIPVDRDFNSSAGSFIDGELANDFLILFRRREFDARGHSNKKPKVHIKNATLSEETKRPIQVEFKGKDGIKVWDSIARKELEEKDIIGKNLQLSFTVSKYGRARFAAKVALATGYFVYGELFRNSVNHEEIRKLMNISNNPEKDDFENVSLRLYDEFMETEKIEDDSQRMFDGEFCKILNASCVIIIPGPSNIGFVIGVLGQHVATLNISANTDAFPLEGDYDLGHVIVLKDSKIERFSYRELAKRAYNKMNG